MGSHVLEPGMVGPISRGVFGKGKTLDTVLIDTVVHAEQNAQASLCKYCMRRLDLNMIERDSFTRGGETMRRQELLDGRVGKLYYFGVLIVHNRDQTGACR